MVGTSRWPGTLSTALPLQGLQMPVLAKNFDLQILQRMLQVLPHNLTCSVRLCHKPLILSPPVTPSFCGTFHALFSWYDPSWRPSVTQRCGALIRKACHV